MVHPVHKMLQRLDKWSRKYPIRTRTRTTVSTSVAPWRTTCPWWGAPTGTTCWNTSGARRAGCRTWPRTRTGEMNMRQLISEYIIFKILARISQGPQPAPLLGGEGRQGVRQPIQEPAQEVHAQGWYVTSIFWNWLPFEWFRGLSMWQVGVCLYRHFCQYEVNLRVLTKPVCMASANMWCKQIPQICCKIGDQQYFIVISVNMRSI